MKNLLLALLILLTTASCVSFDDHFKLDAQYLFRRQVQTRRFEADDENAMLVASAQVLQDLGFTLKESETKLGLITASKSREASTTAAKVGIIALAILAKEVPNYDKEQNIFTTLVTTKSRDSRGFNVRVEFAREIITNQGDRRLQVIHDPEIYKEFFDKLSQSVFLAAHDL